METLIQQIADIIQNGEKRSKIQARKDALKEILLAGLSRSGFMRERLYLQEFDQAVKKDLFLSFLNQDEGTGTEIKEHQQVVRTELDAAGVSAIIKDTDSGFRIETEDLNINILVIKKNFGLKPVISYRQVPIPYEMRCSGPVDENTYTEIQNKIKDEIKNAESADRKKGKPVKSSGKKKNKETDDQILQLSLF